MQHWSIKIGSVTFTGGIQRRRYGLHLHGWCNVRSTSRLKANLCEVTQPQCGRKGSATFTGVMQRRRYSLPLQS